MKPNILIAIIALICHFTYCYKEDEEKMSGIKYSLKTNYAEFLENFDFISLISNKSFLEEPISEGNLLYSITMNSLKFDKLIIPPRVIVENLKSIKTTKVSLKHMVVSLTASFELRLGFKVTKYNDIKLQIFISTIRFDYDFINGKIEIGYFFYHVQDVKIILPYYFLGRVPKKLVMTAIDKHKKILEKELEYSIKNFIIQSTFIQAPMGNQLFYDATSTSSPELFFPNKLNANDAYMRFGIKGRIFTRMNEKDLPAPTEMNFIEKHNDKGVTLLISEYTINNLLDFIQKAGKFSQKFSGSNGLNGLNINSDTIQILFPEFSTYTETKECSIDVSIPMLNYPQPTANVNDATLTIDIDATFNFKYDVQENPDPFEDPVTVLLTEQEVSLKLIPSILDNKLSFKIGTHVIKSLKVKQTTLTDFDKNIFQVRFNKFLDLFFKQVEEQLSVIDFNSLITGNFKQPLQINDFEIDVLKHYIALSFNVEYK